MFQTSSVKSGPGEAVAQTGTKSTIVRGRRPHQEEERAGFPEPWQTVSKIREEGRGQRIPGKGHLQGALRNIPEMVKWAGCVGAELLTEEGTGGLRP